MDKFVDLRFNLAPNKDEVAEFAREIALALPEYVPLGDHVEFSIERVGKFAFDLAPLSGLTIRQIKRVFLKVEVALRCYSGEPVDCAVLVFLAFSQVMNIQNALAELPDELRLKRIDLTPERGEELTEKMDEYGTVGRDFIRSANKYISKNCPELLDLSIEVYGAPMLDDHRKYHDWALVLKFLARHYLPRHQAMLDAVQELAIIGTDAQPE